VAWVKVTKVTDHALDDALEYAAQSTRVVHRHEQRMDSRPRQKHSGMTFLRAESTPQNAPQKHPSPYIERLGGIEKKYSGALKRNAQGYWTKGLGGMTEGGDQDGSPRE
jgi:hypothetical protein